jgi:hypothetical protein
VRSKTEDGWGVKVLSVAENNIAGVRTDSLIVLPKIEKAF